jgi:hypothetical protein
VLVDYGKGSWSSGKIEVEEVSVTDAKAEYQIELPYDNHIFIRTRDVTS